LVFSLHFDLLFVLCLFGHSYATLLSSRLPGLLKVICTTSSIIAFVNLLFCHIGASPNATPQTSSLPCQKEEVICISSFYDHHP
jgi:hypothetical protein